MSSQVLNSDNAQKSISRNKQAVALKILEEEQNSRTLPAGDEELNEFSNLSRHQTIFLHTPELTGN